MIVLIDRVFVLAHPAPDSRTMKVQKYCVFALVNFVSFAKACFVINQLFGKFMLCGEETQMILYYILYMPPE